MAQKWRKVTDEIDMFVGEDGIPVTRFRENDRPGRDAKERLRKMTKGKGIEYGQGIRMTASIPISEKIRMEERYGTDPDAQAAFLRDNPEHRLSKDVPGAHPKRTYSFPKSMKRGR